MIITLLIFACMLNFIPLRNRSFKILILCIELIALIMIFAGNNSTPDQAVYSSSYKTGDTGYFEVGYTVCSTFIQKIGLDYSRFKILVALLLIVLIGKGFRGFDIKLWTVSIMIWIWTSFVYEAEQSRFFIAVIIVMYGLQ